MGDGKSEIYRQTQENKEIEEFIKIDSYAKIINDEIESIEFSINEMNESIKNSESMIIEKRRKIRELFKNK